MPFVTWKWHGCLDDLVLRKMYLRLANISIPQKNQRRCHCNPDAFKELEVYQKARLRPGLRPRPSWGSYSLPLTVHKLLLF